MILYCQITWRPSEHLLLVKVIWDVFWLTQLIVSGDKTYNLNIYYFNVDNSYFCFFEAEMGICVEA